MYTCTHKYNLTHIYTYIYTYIQYIGKMLQFCTHSFGHEQVLVRLQLERHAISLYVCMYVSTFIPFLCTFSMYVLYLCM